MAVILTDAFDTAWAQFLYDYFHNVPYLNNNIICAPTNTDLALIKKHIVKNGINLVGVEFWTPNILRTFLIQKLGINKKIATKEHQVLLLREILAKKYNKSNGDFSDFIKNNSEQFLQSIETITFYNETFQEKLTQQEAELAKDFYNYLLENNLTTSAFIDCQLLKIIKKDSNICAQNMLFFGFGTNYSNLKNLIECAVYSSQNSDFICIDEGDDESFQSWLSFLEKISNTELQYIYSDKERKFDSLSQNFNDNICSKNEDVYFFISKNLQLEIEIIKKRLAQIISKNNNAEIGIIVPNLNSFFAKKLSKELSNLDISHFTEIQQNIKISTKFSYIDAWIKVQKDKTVSSFFALLDESANSDVISLTELLIIKKIILNASLKCISNSISFVLGFVKSKPAISSDIGDVANIKILPAKIKLEQFLENLNEMLEAFSQKEEIENLKFTLRDLKQNDIFETENLLDFAGSFLKKTQKESNKNSKEICSKITILSLESAKTQTFSDIIITDCAETNFAKQHYNIFFDKTKCQTEQNILKQVILNTTNSITLTSNIDKTHTLNDFFTKIYASSTNSIFDEFHFEMIKSQTNSFLQKTLPNDTHHNEQQTLDEQTKNSHFFNIGDIKNRKFSCKQWETIIKNPELAYYETVLNTGQNENFDLPSIINISIGNLTHDLLNISHNTIQTMPKNEEFLQKINNKSKKFHEFLSQIHCLKEKHLPLHIENIIESAEQNAKNIAKILTENYKFITTEYNIPDDASIKLRSCEIPVSGRIDAIVGQENFLNNKDTKLTIIDFKTGNDDKFSAKNLLNGEGVQISLYALAMYFYGYKDVEVLILKPDSDPYKIKPKSIIDILDNFEFLNLLENIYLTGNVPTCNVSGFTNAKNLHRLPLCSQQNIQ